MIKYHPEHRQITRGHRQMPPLFKPSLRVTRDAEGPHMIGRESDLLRFDWLDASQFCT